MARLTVVVEIAVMSAHQEKPRGRKLSEEERALWHGIVCSIAPLAPKRTGGARAAKALPPTDKKHSSSASPRANAAPVARAARSVPPLEAFDRRQKQRLARGTQSVDACIDLHGETQSEAYGTLVRFLRKAQRDGAKFALVITGKGSGPGLSFDGSGVLKRQVPHWLGLAEFRPYVVGFEGAHVSHGGAGALYVRIRKAADRKET